MIFGQFKPWQSALMILTVCAPLPCRSGLSDDPSANSAESTRKRPNIILMMADDMGMGDTSAYQDFTGNSDGDQLHTPAMERLARMGVRFTDAHTPSSRCSPTRYGLLTGRYPWRNRLKHWVLFGAQGDPMIEADRPTLATMLRDCGYKTGMVGKWHVGLRFRQSNGLPAASFEDADLMMPLADTPLDHGFEFCRFTSRSHGTSGPQPGKKNKPDQTIGPGHIHGRKAVGATSNGRQISSDGSTAYVLSELGGRHSDSALEFLNRHVSNDNSKQTPFFLYYACNSNHGPYTPDSHVGKQPVAGAARNVDGKPAGKRGDFIFENDVALGRLLSWLSATRDPRDPASWLIENTIVIFTSDNGAEKKLKSATGPFRSNKASCYEGGHRVPFIASWPNGGVGNGDPETPGRSTSQLCCLTDMYATFAEVLEEELPENKSGEKGAEDSFSILSAMKSNAVFQRPVFFNDHKEAADPAVAVLRLDDPKVDDQVFPGQWKLFCDATLLRKGSVQPIELYDLKTDSKEQLNRVSEPELLPLVEHLKNEAMIHRTSGGHRLAKVASNQRVVFDWRIGARSEGDGHQVVGEHFQSANSATATVSSAGVTMTVAGVQHDGTAGNAVFSVNERGLGISSGPFKQVDNGEVLLMTFDKDVIVESVAVVAGNGDCGGWYRVGNNAPLAIYCVDADVDGKDQSGILSDIGVVKAGEALRLDSSPHFGVEQKGRWRVAQLTIRLLK